MSTMNWAAVSIAIRRVSKGNFLSTALEKSFGEKFLKWNSFQQSFCCTISWQYLDTGEALSCVRPHGVVCHMALSWCLIPNAVWHAGLNRNWQSQLSVLPALSLLQMKSQFLTSCQCRHECCSMSSVKRPKRTLTVFVSFKMVWF